jgi:hypothetical protein
LEPYLWAVKNQKTGRNNHGFNLQTGVKGEPVGAYRLDDDRNAWYRTIEMLSRYHPAGKAL